MTWGATADLEEFEEAADWFRSRLPITPDEADALTAHSAGRSWTISGVAQLDIVQMVFESLLDAISDGVPFADWKKTVEPKLTEAWGKRSSARLQVIFRNATSTSYNAGRWRQINEPAIRAVRPYVMFDGIQDARQSAACRERDGKVVPIDSGWLDSNSPPLHHACRSSLRSLTEREALRRGVNPSTEETTLAQDGFGKKPDLTEWQPDPGKYARDLFDEYQLKRVELARTTKRQRLDE